MKRIALANGLCTALNILPHTNVDSLQHGQICLANDALVSQATLQVELTTHGIGYADPMRNQLMDLLNFIAPRRVSGRNALVTQYNEHEPFEVVDYKKVKREPLADFAGVQQRTSTKVSRLVPNRGLTIKLDRDQIAEKPNWQQMHTFWLIDLLTRASILEALAVYTAAAIADTFVWNSEADPDLDLQNVNVNVLAAATGFKANRALYGEAATLLRKIAYRSQDTAGAFQSAGLNDADLATAINVERARVNAERYNGAANAKNTFLGSKVLLFSAQDAESPEDNSNVVRHVANAMGGGDYAVHLTEVGVKSIFITVENYELIQLQHTSGMELITVSGS